MNKLGSDADILELKKRVSALEKLYLYKEIEELQDRVSAIEDVVVPRVNEDHDLLWVLWEVVKEMAGNIRNHFIDPDREFICDVLNDIFSWDLSKVIGRESTIPADSKTRFGKREVRDDLILDEALEIAIKHSQLLCRPELDHEMEKIGLSCPRTRELILMCGCGDYEVLRKEGTAEKPSKIQEKKPESTKHMDINPICKVCNEYETDNDKKSCYERNKHDCEKLAEKEALAEEKEIIEKIEGIWEKYKKRTPSNFTSWIIESDETKIWVEVDNEEIRNRLKNINQWIMSKLYLLGGTKQESNLEEQVSELREVVRELLDILYLTIENDQQTKAILSLINRMNIERPSKKQEKKPESTTEKEALAEEKEIIEKIEGM